MKKILFAGLVAVSLVALSQQHASAWCKFGIGGSFNCTYSSGGKHWSFNSEQPAACCEAPNCQYGYMPPGYTNPTGAISYNNPQAPGAQGQMPAAQAMADPSQWGYGQAYQAYQTVGYSYQDAAYGYNPYYYQAPSYWYGR
jgi:hypothetical protein